MEKKQKLVLCCVLSFSCASSSPEVRPRTGAFHPTPHERERSARSGAAQSSPPSVPTGRVGEAGSSVGARAADLAVPRGRPKKKEGGGEGKRKEKVGRREKGKNVCHVTSPGGARFSWHDGVRFLIYIVCDLVCCTKAGVGLS